MQQHEHFHFETREQYSAFVPGDVIVYYGGGDLTDFFKRPSFSVWIVPGTTKED